MLTNKTNSEYFWSAFYLDPSFPFFKLFDLTEKKYENTFQTIANLKKIIIRKIFGN